MFEPIKSKDELPFLDASPLIHELLMNYTLAHIDALYDSAVHLVESLKTIKDVYKKETKL